MFDWQWNRAWSRPWKIAFGVFFITLIAALIVLAGAFAFKGIVEKVIGVEAPYIEWVTGRIIYGSLNFIVVSLVFIAVIIITAKLMWR